MCCDNPVNDRLFNTGFSTVLNILTLAFNLQRGRVDSTNGATVLNILDMFGVKSTEHVGVVRIGGLGHLAVQFAAKWGCRVVFFSGSEDTREQAVQSGAGEYYATKGLDHLENVAPIDHLMITTSIQVP